MKILWKLEEDFKEALEQSKNKAMYDEITIKELLDLGFNNNYLIFDDCRKFCLGFKYLDGNYSKKLTDEQLNTKIVMDEDFGLYDDEDTDGDGYHIAKVHCLDEKDEKLFMEVE